MRSTEIMESPLVEPLRTLGFSESAIRWMSRTYAPSHLREWIDITLAAQERFGPSFFRKNPQAYLLDNLKTAAAGTRTPPDWWHDLRKEEVRRRRVTNGGNPVRALGSLAGDGVGTLEKVRHEIFDQFRAAGQTEDVARRNSEKFAGELERRQATKSRDLSVG